MNPYPRIPESDYEEASDLFAQNADGCEDLDGICIVAVLNDIVARALAEQAGDEWYEDDDSDEHDYWLGIGGRAVEALMRTGMIRRSDFAYQDEGHQVLRVSP